MYYLQSRYYNPTWGRFINADALVSTGQGILGNNMFAYCLNNPVAYRDSSGTYPEYTCDNPAGDLGREIGNAIAEWIIGIKEAFPTEEEHHSRNDNQADALEMDPKDILDSNDWERQPDILNMFHRNTTGEQGEDAKDNVKYMTKDRKKEVIINFTDKSNPQIVTDPVNIGTYNFGTSLLDHFILDVIPYWIWGN